MQARSSRVQVLATTEDREMQIHDFQPIAMFEEKWRCCLTNSVKKGFFTALGAIVGCFGNRTELGQLDAERTFYLLSLFCAHIWERVRESGGVSKVLLLFLRKNVKEEILKDVMVDFLLIYE
jgi:hypothetical protein